MKNMSKKRRANNTVMSNINEKKDYTIEKPKLFREHKDYITEEFCSIITSRMNHKKWSSLRYGFDIH